MDLYLYHNLLKDQVIKQVLENNICMAQRLLFDFAENEAISNNIFREYIIKLLIEDENTFSLTCSKGGCAGTLASFAFQDIASIFRLFALSVFLDYERNSINHMPFNAYEQSFTRLIEAEDVNEFYKLLTKHYSLFGCGKLSKYTAFHYRGSLVGIDKFDSITFDDLVGLHDQKETLIENTRAFVMGKKANNVILFGDSGCGKSSSVKALLNEFQNDGLRLIEFSKNYIAKLPQLFFSLRSKPHKYIILMDDLSFEKDDYNYKNLKIAMEGQLEEQNSNVLIYATSNRRHLITEYWAGREGDEVRVNDTRQEKMSLSERFGISIVFVSPSQDEYLEIVSNLLKQANIEMTPQIKREAIIWEMNFNGRSGRTAKQFVTHIAAQNT